MRSRGKQRLTLAIGLTTSATLALVACGTADNDASNGDTVRVVLTEEPATLELCQASLDNSAVVTRSNIGEGLTVRNVETDEVDPLLATDWEQLDDNTWSFSLREGVQFSDGTEFNGAAAKHSIDRAINDSEMYCDIAGFAFDDKELDVEIVDDFTITIETEKPDPILPLRMTYLEMVPESAPVDELIRESVGTGPYVVESWNAGQDITLVKNENYWGDAPEYETAKYFWREEGPVRAAMVTNGEADIAIGLAPEDGADDYTTSFYNNETVGLRATGTIEPLDDLRVRQAIKYAIDRDNIVSTILDGLGTSAAQPVQEGVVGHDDSLEPWPYDPEKAEELLDEARADGVDVDQQIRFLARSGQYPRINQVAENIQSAFQDVGLNVSIEMMETANHLDYQSRPIPEDSGPYILMYHHGNHIGDAALTMDNYMRSDGSMSTFGTDALDDLIDSAQLKQGDERQEALAEVFAAESEDVGQHSYIFHQESLIALGDSVQYEPVSMTEVNLRLADVTSTSEG